MKRGIFRIMLISTLKFIALIVLDLDLGHFALASIKKEGNREAVPEVTGDLLESRRVIENIYQCILL